MQQTVMFRIDPDEPGFDLAQAQRAPEPRQVAAPVPNDSGSDLQASLRLLLDVCGNVLGGGVLFAALLAAPWAMGRLAGLF